MDEETIILSEVVTDGASVAHQSRRNQPGTLFANPGSNLGWGLGASLGAKLAAPDKTVVGLISDGSFVFGCPLPTLWAAIQNHTPFLAIVYNNQRYNAPMNTIRNLYGKDSFCVTTGVWTGCEIMPSPEYAVVARACNAYGDTVKEPTGIIPALRQALERVRKGQPAVVDIRMARLRGVPHLTKNPVT